MKLLDLPRDTEHFGLGGLAAAEPGSGSMEDGTSESFLSSRANKMLSKSLVPCEYHYEKPELK